MIVFSPLLFELKAILDLEEPNRTINEKIKEENDYFHRLIFVS